MFRVRLVVASLVVLAGLATAARAEEATGTAVPDTAPPLLRQTQVEADAKSAGCRSCHGGIEPMQFQDTVEVRLQFSLHCCCF